MKTVGERTELPVNDARRRRTTRSGHSEEVSADLAAHTAHDGQTRAAVVSLLVEDGPLTAGEIAERLGISAAGVRRHLDALSAAGDVETSSAGYGRRGRGRPAKWFQLTPTGRGKLRHAYDDLAGAALLALRTVGGQTAVEDFARDRITRIVAEVPAADSGSVARTVEGIADALTGAGFSANTRKVGNGIQICQHHCPVAHVAEDFPELCEAETAVFSELLGTHVQRLATIANGDCACTTHVPLSGPGAPGTPGVRGSTADPPDHSAPTTTCSAERPTAQPAAAVHHPSPRKATS
ncbi:helix-turn-helix transcriptional regulator [Gordonia pseudamarae]|uniref:helix-turn-helix transcriptional regulator n=1 Tax=Gordonia pseudamarae TaxID=2831662 RepID=UPI0019A03DFE|nr:transcriptional regulator [Gordonia sp. (in: high G+C Gram-positive bacteria)]